MANIIFKRLTQSQYDGLSNIDKDTLYFTTDTHNLYGNTGQYSSGIYKSVTLSSESSTVNFIDLITQNVDKIGNYLFKKPADNQLSIVFNHVLVSFNYINISSDTQLENFLINALSEFKIQILQYIPGSDNDLNFYIGNSEVLGRFIVGNVTGSSTEYEIYLANPGSLSYQPEHGDTEYIGSVYSAPYDMLSSSQENSSINIPLMYDDNVATIYNAGDIKQNSINEYIHLAVDPTKSKSKNITLQFDTDARSVISTLATLDDIPNGLTWKKMNAIALPSEYTQVTSLNFTGQQAFDTGFIPTGDTRFVIKYSDVSYPSGSYGRYFFGVEDASIKNKYTLYTTSRDGWAKIHIDFDYGTVHNELDIRNLSDKVTEYFKENQIHIGTADKTISPSTFNIGRTLYIGANHNSDTAPYYDTGTLHSFRLYQFTLLDSSGNILHSYYPVYKTEGSIVTTGLYDIVDKKFIESVTGTQCGYTK